MLSSEFGSPDGTDFKNCLLDYLGIDWDESVRVLGSENAAWDNLWGHINAQYDNIVLRAKQAEQGVQTIYQDPRYQGLSDERKAILLKFDKAESIGDKIVFAKQFLGQGWAEPITNYWNSQYQLALSQGMSPEYAAIAADYNTWNLLGSALSTAVRTGDVAGSGLGNLLSKGSGNLYRICKRAIKCGR